MEGGEETRRQETIHRLVNNRNNLEALFLKRTLVSYEKELFIIIKKLDEEKLDWMEFTKRIRHCGSDAMPEFDWVYKTMRERPPSPIDLQMPACLRGDMPFPVLPQANNKHSLVNQSGSDLGVGALRISRTATARDAESRSRHEATREDLRGEHTVTRRDADLDRIVQQTSQRDRSGDRAELSRDVLTKLPSIQPKSKSSRNHRSPAGLVSRSESSDGRPRRDLIRTSTDLELGRRPGQQAHGEQYFGANLSVGHERSHLSTSDIPDTLLLEYRDGPGSGGDGGRDSRLTPRAFGDRRRTRQRGRAAKPLGERVGDFYKRFDMWLVEGSKPGSEQSGELPEIQFT